MSKKTRRQKEVAQERQLNNSVFLKSSKTDTTKALTSTQDTYFKRDLSKSILISSVIFILEAGLYLAQQYGFLSLSSLINR